MLRGIILNLECTDMWKTELHNIAVLRMFLLLFVFYTSFDILVEQKLREDA